jgi:hypothetical protein
MAKSTSITILAAAAALSAVVAANYPARATPLGAAIDTRLGSETVDPVTNVTWWGHHRFHRPFFFHHRAFFFHRAFAFQRFHHRPFFHRFHRCWWC